MSQVCERFYQARTIHPNTDVDYESLDDRINNAVHDITASMRLVHQGKLILAEVTISTVPVVIKNNPSGLSHPEQRIVVGVTMELVAV